MYIENIPAIKYSSASPKMCPNFAFKLFISLYLINAAFANALTRLDVGASVTCKACDKTFAPFSDNNLQSDLNSHFPESIAESIISKHKDCFK